MAKKKSTGTKLTKAELVELEKVGITGVTTKEEAKAKMVEYLSENDIDDCEDDPYDEVLAMVQAIYEDSDDENSDAAAELDEEEEDEAEDSDEEEDDDEEEDEDDDEEEDEDEDSDEDDEDEDEDEDDSDEEEDEDDEEEAEEEEKANDKKQKKAVKKTTAKAKKTAQSSGENKPSKRLNPAENADDAAKYDGLKEVLDSKGNFDFNFIANGGVSIKHIGKNSKKVFLSFDSPKVTKEGDIVGRVYMSSVRDEEVLQGLFGEDIETKKSWSGNILIIGMPLEELISTLYENWSEFEAVLGKLTKKDEKLGKNREKMEKDLKSTKKSKATAAKATAKKATAKKPAAKTTAAKTTTAKKTTAKVKKAAKK